ncbi:sulfate/molybdate ABC transporter ATP-binding protein [Anaerocolumna sp.]|uniref:sulfate/molybdate ABC transporter ATP-binding protein n=1 Tax=Anaerocolumna sp. TaxID=2041569 RepID=UPI0028B246A5|nr:ATP-binding cassette domain-containing protein [Anaerocolumna sp.]
MSLKVHIHTKLKGFELNVDFETNGKPMGILGASGSGKSMTLKCIAGIMTPDEGYIELGGKVLFDSKNKINLKPQERKVGYLFQNYALFPNMTVAQNIAAGIRGSKNEKAQVVTKMLRNFHLQGLEKRYPSQLSGGQQQRVALARMLAYEPDALLLDEPFSALDAYLKEELQLQLHDLLGSYEGESLLVTHSRNEVYELTKDLIVMDHGKILMDGETKNIFLEPVKMQAAKLTGCKNLSRAKKISDNQVEALDWGIILNVNAPIPDKLTGIGIRAHDFKPFIESNSATRFGEESINKIPCKVKKITESPFEWIVLVDTKKNDQDSDIDNPNTVINNPDGAISNEDSVIWWKIGKNQLNSQLSNGMPEFITVAPEDILLLID